jgi:transcriptional regulator CtsR
MRKATQKEFETVQEVFSLNYVKVLFKQLLEEELITKKEYELLIKKLDEDINKVLDKGGLMWKKEK